MRIALAIMFSISAVSLSAQTPVAPPEVEAVLIPGKTVWITEKSGREEKVRIIDVSGGSVTASAGEVSRRIRTADVVRVRARQSDSVLNGALIGAGVAVASGLFLCTLSEPWDNCRDDVAPMLRSGAIGAAAGIGIDALIRRRRTIYEALPRGAFFQASPIVSRHAGGLQVTVSF
jgi:hypothetical protein